MTAVDRVRQVLASNLLISGLVFLPSRGASAAEVHAEIAALARSLSAELVRFLMTWNGANLDVLLLFGCAGTDTEIPGLRHRQALLPAGLREAVAIGSDPAGFVFVEGSGGEIIAVDTEGGDHEVVGTGFDDFICRYVFGEDSDRFGGDAWKCELKAAGLL